MTAQGGILSRRSFGGRVPGEFTSAARKVVWARRVCPLLVSGRRAEEGPRCEAGMIYCNSAASARTGQDTGRPTRPLPRPKAGPGLLAGSRSPSQRGRHFAQPQESTPGHWLFMSWLRLGPARRRRCVVLQLVLVPETWRSGAAIGWHPNSGSPAPSTQAERPSGLCW
jgi:hypothetical protein